jgi:hypothetical protein
VTGWRDRARRVWPGAWPGWLLVAFLAVQVAAPLHYYTLRDDRLDERFAWRMFSPTRVIRCEPRFYVDGRPVELGARYHEAWVGLARRGRRAVLDAMAADLCAAHPGGDVALALTCARADRRRLHTRREGLCRPRR